MPLEPTPATRYGDVLLEAVLDGSEPRTPGALAELLAAKAVELVECAMGAIRLPDEHGTALRVVTVSGIEQISPSHAAEMREEIIDLGDIRSSAIQPGPRSPSAEAFLGGEIQVVADIVGAARTGFTMRSMAAVPLIHAGHARGVMTLYWRDRHRPDARELDGLALIGHRAALALDIASRADDLRVRIESLTRRLARARTRGDELQAAVRILAGTLNVLRDDDPDPLRSVLALLTAATAGDFSVTAEKEGASTTDGWSVTLADPPRTRLASGLSEAPAPVLAEAIAAAASAALDRAARSLAEDASAAGAALLRLCRGGPASALEDAAAALGLLREPPLVVLVGHCIDDAAAYRVARTLARAPLGVMQIAVTDLGRSVIVLCAAGEEGLSPVAAARFLALDGVEGIGIGDRFTAWRALPAALERTLAAARISIARGEPVLSAEVQGLADVAAALDPAQAARLVEEVLGPLRRYDLEHRTELLPTLRTLLDADGSPVVTGQRLHLHPNTVKQRMSRIEKVLGSSLRDYRSISRISLALSWHDLLEGSAGDPR